MPFIGKTPTAVPITSNDLADNIVTTAKINADAVTSAKLPDDVISEEHLDPTIITALSQKSTPADADKLILSDSADSNNLKYVLKSALGGGGTYTIHAIDTYRATGHYGQTTSTDYKDIADGGYVQFTPTSTNDFILFAYTCPITPYTGMGMNTYLMMSTSSSIGSGDTKLDYDGRDMGMYTGSSAGVVKATKSKTFLMPCTGLTVGTTYYVEQAGSSNFNGNWGYWNNVSTNQSGSFNNHYVSMIHYKA